MVHVNAEIAGAFKSGEVLRLLWRAPEVRVGWLWPQREVTMRRSLEAIYDMAKAFGVSSYEMPRKGTIILPSREMKEPPRPAKPKAPEGEEVEAGPPEPPAKPKLVPHKVGKFGWIDLERGPYFTKTPTEINQEVQAVQAAAGGVPVLSEETAVEEAAQIMGIDPAEELRRMHEEKERNMALQAKQFGLGGDGGGERGFERAERLLDAAVGLCGGGEGEEQERKGQDAERSHGRAILWVRAF
mgnify:CR=1 FL=1